MLILTKSFMKSAKIRIDIAVFWKRIFDDMMH